MHIVDPINNTFLDLGFFTWQMYSVMIMLGLGIAIVLGIKEGNRLGITTDDILDGVLIIVPLSIIGTRLWYVAFEWERYANNLWSIFDITSGGLAIHGGFITAFISAFFYTRWKKINVFAAVDIMAPGFLIAQAFGRWGNFFNREAHGGMIGGVDAANDPILSLDEQRAFLSETLHLPDFITDNMLLAEGEGYWVEQVGSTFPTEAAYYHPTFLYESVWNLIGFIIMLILRRTKLTRLSDQLSFYLIWYSVGRFFIEGMRTDSLYIGSTQLRTAQIISLVMIAAGIALLTLSRTVFKQNKYHVTLEKFDVLNQLETEMNEYKVLVEDEEELDKITKSFLQLKEQLKKQNDNEWINQEHPEIETFKTTLEAFKELSKA